MNSKIIISFSSLIRISRSLNKNLLSYLDIPFIGFSEDNREDCSEMKDKKTSEIAFSPFA
jgi:hypothetical protein